MTKGSMQPTWEVVVPPPSYPSTTYADTRETQRLRVPGGWLYQVRHWEYVMRLHDPRYEWSVTATTMVFVPDALGEPTP